jgi:hypothetical protein
MDLQKGGSAGSRIRTVIGLDHQLGHIQKKYGWESTPGCAAKCLSLMGTSDHLCRVYKKYQEIPCSRKELRMRQERSPSKL